MDGLTKPLCLGRHIFERLTSNQMGKEVLPGGTSSSSISPRRFSGYLYSPQ